MRRCHGGGCGVQAVRSLGVRHEPAPRSQGARTVDDRAGTPGWPSRCVLCGAAMTRWTTMA